MAGSSDRRAAEAATHSQFQPEGEKLWKGETERETGVCRSRSEWRPGRDSGNFELEALTCGELQVEAAGSVARMSVTRGDASGLGPTRRRAGIPPGLGSNSETPLSLTLVLIRLRREPERSLIPADCGRLGQQPGSCAGTAFFPVPVPAYGPPLRPGRPVPFICNRDRLYVRSSYQYVLRTNRYVPCYSMVPT